MADYSTIIMPINVQSVRVLEEDKPKFKGPTVRFDLISDQNLLGEQICQNLPDSTPLITEGVHLHWSLPDSLTHGVHDPDSDSIVFPAVPNRWLVTRYFMPEDGGLGLNAAALAQYQAHGVCVSQWVIESNRILGFGDAGTTNMMTSIPVLENSPPAPSGTPLQLPTNLNTPNLEQKLLGKLQSYDNTWQDGEANHSSAYAQDLNAISYYGPGFAAYYPNSSSVLGFSDNFADLGYGSGKLFGPKFRVSYQIIGWFSNSEANDIAALLLPKAQQAYTNTKQQGSKLAYWVQYLQDELKWQASTPVQGQAGDDWPASVQSLYNGIALDIVWAPEGTSENQAFLPQPQDVADSLSLELAMGNNSAEAISALISIEVIVKPESSSPNQEPYPVVESHVELLFNAFQQDLLRRLAGTDPSVQLPQIEEYLHNRRYAARNGGTIWSVRPQAQTKDQSKSAGEVVLPKYAAELLSLLNAAQQTYDRQLGALHSRQLQAYLDWTHWGLAVLGNSSDPFNDSARSYVESELLQIFTESGLSGELGYSTPDANGRCSLEFQPIWTAPNTSAAAMIGQLASTENYLRISFAQAFQKLQAGIIKAQATYVAGDSSSALNFLQTATSDQGWQKLWADLSNLFNNSTLISNLNVAVNTNLVKLAADLNQAFQSNATQTGFKDIVAVFVSGNDATPQFNTFISTYQNLLFNGTNLVDTQQIWVHIEAANYDLPNNTVSVAKLVAAQTAFQNTINDLQNLVKPALSAALAALNQTFPALSKQMVDTMTQLKKLTQDLSSGATLIDQDFSILLEGIENALADNNFQYSCAHELKNAWQALLGFLPTGHQVVLLLDNLADAVLKINAQNIVQSNTADSYWLPNDPVVLITQPDNAAQSLLPVNRNGAATLLPYRVPTDLVNGLGIKMGNQSWNLDAPNLNQTALPQLGSNPNLGTKAAAIQALLVEAYLCLPQTAQDVLSNAARIAAAEVPALQDVQVQLAQKLLSDQDFQLSPPIDKNLSFSSGQGSNALSVTFNGVAPYYIGLNHLADSNPFLPLYLAWTADFDTIRLSKNDGASLDPDFISSGFILDADHVELSYGVPSPPPLHCSDQQRSPQSLSGQVTLSTRSADNLLNQIRVYFLNTLNVDIAKGPLDPSNLNDFQKDLSTVYEYFRKKTILSQGLNGFNTELALQLALLQTPLNAVDPSDMNTTSLFVFLQQNWKNAQWNRATVGADSSNIFLPVRAGRLRLRELYVVDTFGRYFSLGSAEAPIQQSIALASGLAQIPGKLLVSNCNGTVNETKPKDAYLPPRLLQPARLIFEWLSASADEGGENTFVERTKNPAFTPITGWLLPNHLDDSLAFFDSTGNALGALGIEGTNRQQTWRSVPSMAGQNPAENGHIQMLADIKDANPFLQDFLQKFAFPSGGNSAYQDFLNALGQAQQFIYSRNIMEDKGLAVLMGHPLVLVRAYLRLEVLGLPNVDLSSEAFKAAVEIFAPNNQNGGVPTWMDYDYSQRSNAGFDGLAIPLNLGDLHQFDDGLLGYFLGDDWSTFYTPVADSNSGAVQKSSWGTIQLLPNADNQSPSLVPLPQAITPRSPHAEVVLTLIMDPRAAIHATTGVLPVKSLRIPAEQYRPILRKLSLNFLSNPVMVNKQNLSAGGQSFSVPLPTEKGYDWSWVQPGLSDTPLEPNTVSDRAQFPTTPNEMLDGWLKLQPNED